MCYIRLTIEPWINYIYYMNVPVKKSWGTEQWKPRYICFTALKAVPVLLLVWWSVFLNGIAGGIWTPDPLVPNQMRYQTALLLYEITAILLQDSNLYFPLVCGRLSPPRQSRPRPPRRSKLSLKTLLFQQSGVIGVIRSKFSTGIDRFY